MPSSTTPSGERAVAARAVAILADDDAGAPLLTRDADRRLRSGVALRGLEAAEFGARTAAASRRTRSPARRDRGRGARLPRARRGADAHRQRRSRASAPTGSTSASSSRSKARRCRSGRCSAPSRTAAAKLLLIDGSYLSLTHPVFEPLRELIEEAGSLHEWETGVRDPPLPRRASGRSSRTSPTSPSRPSRGARPSPGCNNPGGIEPVAPPGRARPRAAAVPARGVPLAGVPAPPRARRHPRRRHGPRQDRADARAVRARDRAVGCPDAAVPRRRPDLGRLELGGRGRPLRARPAGDDGRRHRRPPAGGASRDVAAGADIVVTSYAILRLDADAFAALDWAGLVLDEAQFVKNGASKANAAARDIRAPVQARRHRHTRREQPDGAVGAAEDRGAGAVPVGARVRRALPAARSRTTDNAERLAAPAPAHPPARDAPHQGARGPRAARRSRSRCSRSRSTRATAASTTRSCSASGRSCSA